MKKTTYFLGTLMLACSLTQAQDRKTEKAQKDFENYAYADAIESYGNLVADGQTDEQIFKNLGNAHYLNADYVKASDWYGKLFDMENTDIEADYMYRYAQTLKSLEDYEASQDWMQKFEAATKNDVRARKFADNPDYLEDIERHSGRYTLRNLPINSTGSDFAPSLNGEQLVFATARDTGTASRKLHGWNDQPFLNLYRAKHIGDGNFESPVKLSKSLNKKTHESSAAFTKDGTTLYFTRNNSENGRFVRDGKDISRLKIYRATLRGREWTDITVLPFNDDAHSAAHPTLSPDEKQLYFASDMEGSLGQSDIFVVDILEDGSFGKPRNLGNKINTEARETFPYVTDSNLLYFASDGHPGLGGLDVFATDLKNMENSSIVNLGKPVNGTQDDFSYIIDEKTKKGFFASNREGGQGSDDIYGFTENKAIDFSCSLPIAGTVMDEETGATLAGAKVVIFDERNNRVSDGISGNDGSFAFDGDCQAKNYRLEVSIKNYEEGKYTFTIANDEDVSDVQMRLGKKMKVAPVAVGTDLIKFLDLEPVYFDLDKSDIRPNSAATILKVIAYLNEYQNIKIQVRSHTDAKADAGYNERLSKRRAESTVDFLIEKGISADRVSGKGLGESQLLNECDTQTLCSDKRHEENRRSEFVVVE